jgi:ADP-heptose:LPS heptosyltransferase
MLVKIKHMKFLDKYAGVGVVALLSLLSRVFLPRNPPAFHQENVRKVLLIKFWGLGSILLLSPTLRQIRESLPHAKLIFFTSERNREICQSIGLFDEILYLEVDRGWLVFCQSLMSNILHLMRARYDMVIDFEFFTRFSAMITFFTFSPVRIGYHAWETWRGDIHNIKVPFNRYWHIMDNFYNPANYLGLPKQDNLVMSKPAVSHADKVLVDSLLAEKNISGPFISVHVNASDLVIERRWPYDNFVELGKRLLASHPDITLIFIGSASEGASVEQIIRSIGNPRAVDMVAKISLTQLAYLFESSILVISNDSGPLHLAVAMETPTVSFFGPETPSMYGPRGPNHTVIFKNTDCSPCVNVHDRKSVHCRFEKPRCVTMITVQEALAAVEGRLATGKKA